jgi:hypothetical protein
MFMLERSSIGCQWQCLKDSLRINLLNLHNKRTNICIPRMIIIVRTIDKYIEYSWLKSCISIHVSVRFHCIDRFCSTMYQHRRYPLVYMLHLYLVLYHDFLPLFSNVNMLEWVEQLLLNTTDWLTKHQSLLPFVLFTILACLGSNGLLQLTHR